MIRKYYTTCERQFVDNIPWYVRKEFQNYIKCGILAHGFACAYCNSCNNNFLIAFSCKGRGICPSCNSKAMSEIAAHLIDNLIPPLPVRQWVISFPKRIRNSGLSNDEKSSEAKQMYHYFIANTDFHYLPDFLLDPIVEKLGNALIDEILF